MTLRVELLGLPSIVRDGDPIRLGGRKTWGLLAYLVLEERAPSRRDVIRALIPEANDPLAALRWLLHQVRRALQPGASIDEVDGRLVLRLGSADVDVCRLVAVSQDVDEIESLTDGELLEGMAFDDAPAFELWLSLQRTRLHHIGSEALWWAATRLGSKDPDRAMHLVRRGLALDPYCETKHELMVDLYLQQGQRAAALEHLGAAERIFRQELGEPLPDTIRRPLERVDAASTFRRPVPSARALLEATRARMLAGDHDHAVSAARRAADASLAAGDRELELDSLLLLSSALIHPTRGRRLEAKGLLSRAAQLATELGRDDALTEVEREMGFVLALEGNLGAAEALLTRGVIGADATGDGEAGAKARTYLGICRSDRGEHAGAIDVLTEALERFGALGMPGWEGYALGMLARVILRSGDVARAQALATRGIERCRVGAATGFLPWPMLVAADSALARNDLDGAQDGFVGTRTLAAENGDAIVEALALRGMALIQERRNDRVGACDLLRRAVAGASRFDDAYAWAYASILTDLVEREDPLDEGHLDDAIRIAEDGPMPDLAERLRARRDRAAGQTAPQTAAP